MFDKKSSRMRPISPPEQPISVPNGDYVYQFGIFKLDPAERSLTRRGESVPLTPKAFDTLCVLVENSERLVSKQQLLERVWPETYVEEKTLAQNVFTLRKALGVDSHGRDYIETVPKKGYRFFSRVQMVPRRPAVVTGLRLAPVDIGEGEIRLLGTRSQSPRQVRVDRITKSQAIIERCKRSLQPMAAMTSPLRKLQWSRQTVRAAAMVGGGIAILVASLYFVNGRKSNAEAFVPRSVAVLPFKAIGSSEELNVIGLGMANSVILDLSSMKSLTVLPTSSVFKYTQRERDAISIGRELGVDAVLDGTIQRSDDKVHVTALLIRSSDGKSLWSGRFDGNFTDTFALQDSISSELTATLAANIHGNDPRSVQKRPDNLTAYNSYLFGLFFWNKRSNEDVVKAISYLEQSIKDDPKLAVAHALLARCYFRIATVNSPGQARSDAIARARAEVTTALELDSNLSDAYTVLAYLSLDEGNFPLGEQHFHRALELDPNNGEAHLEYGTFLYTQAKLSEADMHLKRAQQLAPLSPHAHNARAYVLFILHDYDGVIAACRKALELKPDLAPAQANLARAYALKGMFNEALTTVDAIKQPVYSAKTKVFVEGLAGRTAEARQALEQLKQSAEKPITPYEYAVAYAAIGNKARAFESLSKAIDEVGQRESKQFLAMLFKFDPQLDSLRSDNNFAQCLSRLQT